MGSGVQFKQPLWRILPRLRFGLVLGRLKNRNTLNHHSYLLYAALATVILLCL